MAEKFLTDDVDRHFLSGPTFKGSCTLEQKHIQSVKYGTSGSFGHLIQFCLAWIVDDIAYNQSREQHGCVRDRALIVMWRHTYVGSIGQNGTFGNALAHLLSVCKIINVNIAGGMFADAVCECQCTVKFFREFQLKDVDV